jgi:hypothetical protein
MKNAIVILFAIIILSSTVYADEGIQEFNYGQNITINEVVSNQSGQPCTKCTCNLTVYYANNPTVINFTALMTNKGNGKYEKTVPQLNISDKIYPVVLKCNQTTFWGLSSIKGIKVNATAFDFTSMAVIMLGITIFFYWAGLTMKPTDAYKIWIQWTLIIIAFFFTIADVFFALIISSIGNFIALKDFFTYLLWAVAIIALLVVGAFAIYMAMRPFDNMGKRTKSDDYDE